ncbi:hypothetical protein BCR32DRAFT_115150 [Anaeromyces robustus]|uniref:DUF3533 domain-containing protein n=1 Tax=Anaeromyces robustus TaxID=1754192 RepID=A0A1Y1VVP9_9FUNG|nr:hypothetical protein BCR32DRAFT_115150 [Anaeromyces robustus]|eukprot:ORX65368.1 hypothetical protein BCR32DRAFT_115150 [Anaeromyces robustus]
MLERDVSSVPSEMVSYDKVDPLPTENPFYFNEDSKINQFVQKAEKKFPFVHMSIFLLIIPLMAFLMAMFYIGGIWEPTAKDKLNNLKYIIVNEDEGCVSPICQAIGLNSNLNIGNSYAELNSQGYGQFEVITGDEAKAIDLIDKQDCWISLHIPKSFTSDIISNLKAINATKYKDVTVDQYYSEARSYTTVNFAKKTLSKLTRGLFLKLVENFEDKGGFKPEFLFNSIIYKENSLRTVEEYGQYFCTFVSFILLWIGTIATALITHFVFPLENHWIEKKDVNHAIAKTISAKALTCGIIMFVISLIISIIPLCCGNVRMDKSYAAVLFFFFFFSLSGLGVNNLLVHLFHFINFYLVACAFMILQFITCGGVIHRDLQFGFFKIGKAFPMFSAVREIKYIYWGEGKHHQAGNILIILGWAVVFLAASFYLYYLELKVKRAKYLKRNSKN